MNARHLIEFSTEYKKVNGSSHNHVDKDGSDWTEAFASADLAARFENVEELPQLLSPALSQADNAVLNLFDELDKMDKQDQLVFAKKIRPIKEKRILLPKATKKSLTKKKSDIKVHSSEFMRPKTPHKVDFRRLNTLSQPRKDPFVPASVSTKSKVASIKQPTWIDPNHKDYSCNLPPQIKDLILRSIYDPASIDKSSRSNSPSARADHPAQPLSSIENLVGAIYPPPSAPSSARPSTAARPRTSHRKVTSHATSAANPQGVTISPAKANQKAKEESKSKSSLNDVEGSKPLEWSKQFGERGRKLYQKVIVEGPKKIVKPPSTLAEDLVKMACKMAGIIMRKLVKCLPRAIPFANEYIEALREFMRSLPNNDNYHQFASRLDHIRDRLKLVVDYVEKHSRDTPDVSRLPRDEREAGKGKKETEEATEECKQEVQEVDEVLSLNDSELAFSEIILLCKSVPNSRSLDELLIIIAWVLENMTEEEAGSLLKQYVNKVEGEYESILLMVNNGSTISSDRGIVHEKIDQKEFKDNLDRIKTLYFTSNRLFDLSLCLLHHQNAVRQSNVNEDGRIDYQYNLGMDDKIVQNNIQGESNLRNSISISTADISQVTSNTHANNNVGLAVKSDKSQIFSTIESSQLTSTTLHIPPPVLISENLVPIRPTTAGKARPLGRLQAVTSHRNASPRKSTYLQRYTEAKTLYLQSTEYSRSSPSRGNSRSNQNLEEKQGPAIPSHIVLLPCAQHQGLTFFREVVSSNTQRINMLLLDDIRCYKRNKHVLQDCFAIPSQEIIAQRTYAARNIPKPTSPNRTTSADTNGSNNSVQLAINSTSVDAFDNSSFFDNINSLSEGSLLDTAPQYDAHQFQDKDSMFLNIAPILTLQQKEMILISLLSDSFRSLLMQLSVMCKYTMAGKPLDAADITLVLGTYVGKLMGPSLLLQVQKWLKANQRNEHSFKPANPFLIDAAFQRVASYWPSLIIHLEPDEYPAAENGQGLVATKQKRSFSFCQIKLRWLNRVELARMFRDPDHYQPNLSTV